MQETTRIKTIKTHTNDYINNFIATHFAVFFFAAGQAYPFISASLRAYAY